MEGPIALGGVCRGSALSAQLWGCPAARENWETPSRPAGVAEGQADPVKKPPGRITPWAKSSRIKRGRKSGAVIHHAGWPLVQREGLASAAGEGSLAQQQPCALQRAGGTLGTASSQETTSRERCGGCQPLRLDAARAAGQEGCCPAQGLS